MYRKRPDPEDLARNGLTLDDFAGEFDAEVWPDNAVPVDVFVAMQTQWRVGMRGAIGLDYSVMQPVMRLLAVPRREWSDVFSMVRVMEAEALIAMREG